MDTHSSQDIVKLAKSLIEVQKELTPVVKDSTNPFTKSTYASLNSVMEACRDVLLSHGIWLTQLPCAAPVELGPGHIGLETRLIHAESGQWISGTAVIPLPKNDPQGMGSAMTYARRYSLCAMLGIITEDDDGEAAKLPTRTQSNNRSHRLPAQPPQTQQEVPSPLPRLDGVTYKAMQSQDGRKYVIATGNTMNKKEFLKAAGFMWNSQQRVWWKFTEAA